MSILRGETTDEPRAPGEPLPSEPSDSSERMSTPRASNAWRWAPVSLVFVVAAVSLIRNDVSPGAVVAYAVYLVAAVGLPGLLISRAMIGRRSTIVEDLTFGAVTGLAVQLVVWRLLRSVELDAVIPWWWLAVLIPFAAMPKLRQHWRVSHPQAASPRWSWMIAAISSIVVAGTDLGWFRVNPLPPDGGVAHVDAWWHLAIVREFLRPGPPQLPQVAGEPLTYHANAHAHMAISAVTARVDADLVLLRLWILPVALLGVLLVAFVAQEVSGRSWTGPLAAGMTFVMLIGGYLWPTLRPISNSPLRAASPSQMLVLPLAFAAAWALIRIVRGGVSHWTWGWLGVVVLAGGGAKPTMVLILLGATLLSAAVLVLRDRSLPKGPLLAAVGLAGFQLWTLTGGLDEKGSSITILGSLKSMTVYREITLDTTYRAVNDGLVLDSLSGSRAMVAAAAALGWFGLVHVFHLVGAASALSRGQRRDPATWWLIGALATGVAVFFTLDHSAFSQAYFLHLSMPFGVVLTTALFASHVSEIDAPRRNRVVLSGLTMGAAGALVARGVNNGLRDADTFGMLERVAAPVMVLSVVALGTWVVCRRWPPAKLFSKHEAVVLVLVAMIGVAVPTTLDTVGVRVARWAQAPEQSFDTDDRGFLSANEHAAAVWLDEHSDESDIVASNTQCRELTTNPRTCNAVGFWVSGIAGRRVVIEGWGYTTPAHAAHGEDGLHRNRTAPGWPERYELSIAAIEDPSAAVVDALADSYGTDWIFASRRAGPVSDRIGEFATLAFDNGDVAIYRIDSAGSEQE